MNNNQKIAPVIMDDSQLETEFVCMIEFGEWSIQTQFRFHSTARCVRIMAVRDNTERCVNLRSDRSETSSVESSPVSFSLPHLMLTDNQIPCAHGLDFEALRHAIAVASWISGLVCLTAKQPAAEAQSLIENMCIRLGERLASGSNLHSLCCT